VKKPVLFLLNDRWAVKPANTSSTLMLACVRLGHPVFVTDVVHLQANSSTALFAEALELPMKSEIDSTKKLARLMGKAKVRRLPLADLEAVVIRTAPGKDISRSWAHRLALEVMRLAHENGIRILNNPVGLQRASSKLYTVCLPEEFVPKTMVCHSLQSVQDFAELISGPFVMKPLLGSQGRDVFFLDGYDSLNTRQVVDILGRTGYLVVQEYVPEAVDGDIRVLTLDKEIICDQTPIGVARTPAKGERRSNISLGGSAKIVELTKRQAFVCRKIAKLLAKDGIRFAGIDLVGEKIVEVNVFSPSGLQEFDPYLDRAISTEVMQTLLS
jgi:glutathione synthase